VIPLAIYGVASVHPFFASPLKERNGSITFFHEEERWNSICGWTDIIDKPAKLVRKPTQTAHVKPKRVNPKTVWLWPQL
jgi:hypothetical protein